jgi:hypothetical protein
MPRTLGGAFDRFRATKAYIDVIRIVRDDIRSRIDSLVAALLAH